MDASDPEVKSSRARDLRQPFTGTVAGVPYLAVPPADTDEPTPMILAWHAFEPPRSEAALGGTLPLAALDVWRFYLGLPLFGRRLPEGGVAEINERGKADYLTRLFAPVVDQAAAELPAVAGELADRFPVLPGLTGAVGVGAGGTAALLCVIEQVIPLTAVAVVNPVLDPALVLSARERRLGMRYEWSDRARLAAARLDLAGRAGELAGRPDKPPLLIVTGQRDEVITPEHGQAVHDALAPGFPERTLRHITVPDLAHTMGPEPGLEPGPPAPGNVLVDRALTEWFHLHLTSGAERTHQLHRPE